MTIEEKINNLSEHEAKDMLQNIIENSYMLVQWPECQEYMEEEWFDTHAILALDSEEITGSSAYFIATHKLIK